MPTTSRQSPPSKEPELVLLGVSCRWLAQSLEGIGIRLVVADWFADADIANSVVKVPLLGSFHNAFQALRPFQGLPLLFGGGFETNLELANQLQGTFSLINIAPVNVTVLRDPFQLSSLLQQHGFCMPTAFPSRSLIPQSFGSHERWLAKSACSSGGTGVVFLDDIGAPSFLKTDRGHSANHSYYQEFVAGRCWSAAYLGNSHQCHLLGVAEQLLGISQLGAVHPFQFCGGLSGFPVPEVLRHQLCALGNVLNSCGHCRGLFGVDFILDENEQMWVIEVNPRPTSTMELIERIWGRSLLNEHLACFSNSFPLQTGKLRSEFSPILLAEDAHAFDVCDENRASLRETNVLAKGIFYSRSPFDLVVNQRRTECLHEWHRWGWIADVPQTNSTVKPGEPIFTVFAEGLDANSAKAALFARAAELERQFLSI